jgi:hypothetical protein
MTQPQLENQTPPGGADDTQPPDSNTLPENDDHHHDDEGDPAVRKACREAAALRKRLRDAEAERDQLRDQLDAMRRGSIVDAIEAAGYDGEMAQLIPDTETLLDDNGAIDTTKPSEAISRTATKFNIAPKGRVPRPNPQQGTHGPPQRQPGAEFRAAFAPRPR